MDPSARRTEFGYDWKGRLIEVRSAVGTPIATITRYRYDVLGNRVEQVDALNRITTFSFDAMGRELSRALPLGQSESKRYNAGGDLTSHTDFRGRIAQLTYDVMGLVTNINYVSDPDLTVSYAPGGLRSTASNGSGSISEVRDARNRLVRRTDSFSRVIDYSYDLAGNLVGRRSANQTMNYTFDSMNRMATSSSIVGVRSPKLTTYQYDRIGRRTQMISPDGIQTRFEYDVRDRILAITKTSAVGALIFSAAYQYDASGLRTGATERDETGVFRTVSYVYDAHKRLVREAIDHRADSNDRVNESRYDNVGNRTSHRTIATGSDSLATYVYDNNDRLVQEAGIGLPKQTSYDDNGNVIGVAAGATFKEYRYDDANRLKSFQEGTTLAQFAHDPDGLRISSAVAFGGGVSVATQLLQDPLFANAQVTEQWQAEGANAAKLTHTYAYGAQINGQTRCAAPAIAGCIGADHRSIHADGLGSTRFLTDDVGAVTDQFDYDAFGNEIARTGGTIATHSYRGERFDGLLKAYQLRARDYSPESGRFTQMDAFSGDLGTPISLNKYVYGNADPVNHTDPSGYFSREDQSNAAQVQAITSQSAAPALGRIAATNVSKILVRHLATKLMKASASHSVGAAVMVTALVDTCVRTGRECDFGVPVLSHGRELPEHAWHVKDAITGDGNSRFISPFVLNASRSRLNESPPWYNSSPACTDIARYQTGDVNVCDEYPFASTSQGGPVNYLLGTVSLRVLPKYESNRQGDLLSSFYFGSGVQRDGVSPESVFLSIAIPQLPSFYITRDGGLRLPNFTN